MEKNTESARKYGLWNRFFITLLVANLFSGVCNNFFNSTFSLHADKLGALPSYIGLTGTAFTVGAAFFRIIGGRLADLKGRRIVIIYGSLLFGIASLMFAFVDNLTIMLVLRMFQGIGFAAAATALAVAVTDVLPQERMGEGIAYYGLANPLTQAIGPSIALALFYTQWGFGAVATVSAATLAVAAFIISVCRYEKDPAFKGIIASTARSANKENKKKSVWDVIEKKAVPAGAVQFFLSLSNGTITGFIMLFAEKAGIMNAGIYYVFSAVAVVVARLVTGRLTDKYGSIFSLVPGMIFGISGFVCLIFARNISILFFAAGALNGLCSGMTMPALNAEAINRSPVDRRGVASATFYLPTEIAFAVSSLIGGVLIEHFSYELTFGLSIICILVAFMLSLVFFRKKYVHEII